MSKPRLKTLTGVYNGLAQKIKFARNAYQESLMRPEVRAFAENAAGRGSRAVQARALFHAVRAATNYVADHVGVEYTKAPWTMIEQIQSAGVTGGDCDDQATLNYALLKSIGIPAALRVAWYKDHQDPQHIYAVAYLNGNWVPFDTTRAHFGQEFPYTKAQDFE